MDIENLVKNFCKKTKTVGMPWPQIYENFSKQNPEISQEDFELCMLRQGKKAAESMKIACLKADEKGFDYEDVKELVTVAFWDACTGQKRSPRSPQQRSSRSRIYLTLFRFPTEEYSEASINLLEHVIKSIKRPLQMVRCTNPSVIEIRQSR